MISSRYAVPVILFLVLASIPTLIHTYAGATLEDGKTVADIRSELNGFTSAPYGRHGQEWVDDMFKSEDWFERIYTSPDRGDFRLFVARSYDHKRLYHHPELGLSYGSNLEREGIVRLTGQSDIPVHLYNQADGLGFAGYVLLYGDEFVEDPISHQIKNTLVLLVSPRKPLTIFYISGSYETPSMDFTETPAASILAVAIQDFLDK